MPPRTRKSAAADKAANDTSSTHQPTPDDARNDKEVKRGNWGRVFQFNVQFTISVCGDKILLVRQAYLTETTAENLLYNMDS